MPVIGAHVPLYTAEPEALRAPLRDVFGWRHIDAGRREGDARRAAASARHRHAVLIVP